MKDIVSTNRGNRVKIDGTGALSMIPTIAALAKRQASTERPRLGVNGIGHHEAPLSLSPYSAAMMEQPLGPAGQSAAVHSYLFFSSQAGDGDNDN